MVGPEQLSREEAALILGPPSDAQRQAIDLKRGEVPAISQRCAPRRRAQRFGLRDGLVVRARSVVVSDACLRQVLRVQRWSFACSRVERLGFRVQGLRFRDLRIEGLVESC